MGLRLPRHAHWIAQSRREDAMGTRRPIYFPDGGATLLMENSILRGVAVGAHGCVELRSIGTGDDVLGPVMVDAAGWEIHDVHRRRDDTGCTLDVWKANDAIGVGDVEGVT